MTINTLKFSVSGAQAAMARLAALPAGLSATLAAQAGEIAQNIVETVVNEKLDGQVLRSRTGRLKAAVSASTAVGETSVSGQVSVTGVPYAAILEYGGTTKAHAIEAANGKALAFAFQGKQAFFRRVEHPGSVIAEHPYLRPALQEAADQIVAGFRQALADAAG